jgi:hypothetical protein
MSAASKGALVLAYPEFYGDTGEYPMQFTPQERSELARFNANAVAQATVGKHILASIVGAVGGKVVEWLGKSILSERILLQVTLRTKGRGAGQLSALFKMNSDELSFASRLLEKGAKVYRPSKQAGLGDFIVIHRKKVWVVEVGRASKTAAQTRNVPKEFVEQGLVERVGGTYDEVFEAIFPKSVGK